MSFFRINYGFLQQVIAGGGGLPVTSGLTAWYGDLVNSGVERTTLSNGTTITQWDDQSGNGYHLTASTSGVGNITYDESVNAIYLSGTTASDDAYLANETDVIVDDLNDFTIFHVSRILDNTQANYIVSVGRYAGAADAAILTDQYIIYGGGNNEFTTLSNDEDYIFTAKRTGTTFGDAYVKINGTEQTLIDTNPSNSTAYDNSAFSVNAYITPSASQSRGQLKIKELVVYNRQLSDIEILEVEAYLINKYYKPNNISGLTAWYGDLVNGGTARTGLTNGTAITQWDDQSGNGYHLNVVTGTPSYNTTNNSIVFDGTESLDNMTTPAFGTNNRTIFLVFQQANTSFSYLFGQGDDINGGRFTIENLPSSNFIGTSIGGAFRRFAHTSSINTKYLATTSNNGTSASNINFRVNASALSQASINTSNSINTEGGIQAAARGDATGTGADTASRLNGQLYEAIIFNRELTASEIDKVEAYLNNKYSIY